MTSIFLGLGAALAWGVHDLLVRHISQKASIVTSLFAVLSVGTAACLPFAILLGNWQAMSAGATILATISGAAYVFGCLGLYRAFAEGPVKLVAPIIGAYPILSVGWAALSGTEILPRQWFAVATIVFGVALVAMLSDPNDDTARRLRAMLWALISGVGFATTFALGQAATRIGADWPVLMLTRMTAVMLVLGLLLVAAPRKASARAPFGILSGMGLLDATALGLVTFAGTLPNPEFAAVTTSIFGVVTVILARLILKEPMSLPQWGSVAVVLLRCPPSRLMRPDRAGNGRRRGRRHGRHGCFHRRMTADTTGAFSGSGVHNPGGNCVHPKKLRGLPAKPALHIKQGSSLCDMSGPAFQDG